MTKRWEIRFYLTEKDKEIYEALKKETGIKSDAELVRFAFTRLIDYLNRLKEKPNE